MQNYRIDYIFIYRGVRVRESMYILGYDKQNAYTIMNNMLKHDKDLTYHLITRISH
jgi:hypothetical protein